MKILRLLALSIISLSLIPQVSAHHSDAGLDMQSFKTFEGTVTEYSWRNPHVYIGVETQNDDGEKVEWALQTSSTMTVTRMGWTRESLSPGEKVTVKTHPAMNGRPYGLIESIEKADGTLLSSSFFSGSGEPKLDVAVTGERATSLEGKWIADGDKLVDYPGGYDGFYRAQLVLTEKAKSAQASLIELSAENPESTCIGRPTPGMILSTVYYPIEIAFQEEEQTITLHSEYFDDLRTVYMDGRDHPDSSERFTSGHSIGRWEDDVLIVDTRNFADHRSPYQTGVPSGGQKHVVERYQLINDGAGATIEFTLEDPEYIVGSLYHSREMIFAPQMKLSRFDCDLESTSRFVPQ
ncbi:MAG TPA: hypothetical protein DCY55_04245 [Gammaproteobacteria bacterium]|jgi:hypothetical protein|nr:hypothetical protein [Gammaproteobacteria bacterium]